MMRFDRFTERAQEAAQRAAEIGFIIFVLLPGYVNVFPGILGSIFWLLGLGLTTLGYRAEADS
ncbi:MAG: hypothetical protein C3F07_10950 [Anaerolineales bacterium]|nr:hypothetical protein [Anaerolineae bacterium]PWB72815.1 MAG: hypothetical protein C3F07_10950 [Anaerolineales bacterium]